LVLFTDTNKVVNGLTRVRGFTQDDAHIFLYTQNNWMKFKKVLTWFFMYLVRWDSKTLLAFIERRQENRDKYIGRQLGKNRENAIVIQIKGLNTMIE
jgi:threonyl-tRNA synthetase